jgi:sortase B
MNKKIIAFLVLLTAIGAMAYSGNQLIAAEQIYREGNAVYEDLRSRVREPAAVESTEPQTSMDTRQASVEIQPASAKELPAEPAKVYIPEPGIIFTALKMISEDTAAWLYCPDTAIDYPVMRADDYAYYLYHLPGGAKNANGSLFIDYNCAPDFGDSLTVVYGHNMKSKSMFGSLVEYKSQKYYNEHPFMYLYMEEENCRIELLYGCVIGAGQWRERAFMYKENVDALLAYASYNTTFESNAVYAEGDRIVAMSTCSYDFENARYILIGILKGED